MAAARATITPKQSVQIPEPRTIPTSIEEQIRQRAYDLYLQRAGAEGSEIDDWLAAELEVTAEGHTRMQNE